MAEAFSFRRALDYSEVPLPPEGGFVHELLDPLLKKRLQEEHELAIRDTQEKRLALYKACENDPALRLKVYERCRRDPEWFIDMFVWTYDDRIGEIVPMVLYEFQRRKLVKPYVAMCSIQAPKRYTGMVAKSRALGWSWVSMALRVNSFLFKENWSILIGGQQRDDVDNGGKSATHQSLFGKIRFIIDNLPKWMRDELLGPLYKKDEFNKRMSIQNPMKPLNMLDGKQLGSMFGRGPRYSEVFGDEVAWAEEMEDADTALKSTTNRFFGGSTPKGMVGFFPQMMFGGLAVERFWCWWAEHPFLTLEWYNEQRQHMTDAQIAQELDISFEKSLGSTVIQGVNLAEFFTDKAEYDEHLPLHVWIDPGYADNLAMIWCQWDSHKQEGRIVDVVSTTRNRIDWLVPFITGYVPEYDSKGDPWPHHYNEIEKQIIERHRDWRVPECMGDFAGGAKSANTGTSCWDELDAYGIFVEGVKMPTNEIALEHMNLVLRHCHAAASIRDQRNGPKEQIPTLLEVMAQWRYPSKKTGAIRASTKPVHDRFCHVGDCIKMWCWDQMIPRATTMDVRAKPQVLNQGRNKPTSEYTNPFRS